MFKKNKQSRWYDYLFHLISFLLALLFLAVGSTKLIAHPMHVENFIRWGYPDWFIYVTGAVEVGSAFLILFPMTRYYGASLLMFTMIGAIFTHIRAGEWFLLGNPVIVLILAFMIAIRQIFRLR